ncbi:chitinase, partial [Metarhizium hybridum]
MAYAAFTSRECLYQDALQIDGSQYTHIHFGFGMITHDYQINTGNAEMTFLFENFKLIKGAKRILSFGGWEFSTSPDTYTIFREGVKAANRDSQNQWSQAGCLSGMCLHSGVNLTETINTLVMVTKAGVPSNKVVVGVTSYGQSFGMAQAGCHGPDCLYLSGPLNS